MLDELKAAASISLTCLKPKFIEFMAICSQAGNEGMLGFVHAARGLVTQYTGDAEKASAQILLYQRHKDTMDSKAFEVFDSNEDGYLQLHEAVSAMSIGSEKNEALLKAFGLRADDTDDDTTYWADHYA
ncbi:unnamed protein product [Durusdinium trenchii]|uniref:EF-hand domain-containing protein n=1 Tax=Durusdinium trenchii TaxID=1381693 RepID=A0ABP0LHF9_9DINO